jgi:hypothetical protein
VRAQHLAKLTTMQPKDIYIRIKVARKSL